MAKSKDTSEQTKSDLNVEIVSPEGIVFKGVSTEVILPTNQGEIAILPNHIPLFTKLGNGEVIIHERSGKKKFFAVLGGFAEIDQHLVRVLSDFAVASESIREAEVKEAKKRAEKAMSDKQEQTDIVMLEKELARSILQLDIAGKQKKRRNISN